MYDARKNDFIFINKNFKTEHHIGNKLTLLHQRYNNIINNSGIFVKTIFFIRELK